MTIENQDNTSVPCNADGISVFIGRNAAGECQDHAAVKADAATNEQTIATGLSADSQHVLTAPKLDDPNSAKDAPVAALQQTCVIPAAAKDGFQLHTRLAGFLHSGTTHTLTADDRDVQVNVVIPKLTLTKTCVNDPVPVGDPATWDIVAGNASNDPDAVVTLVDVLVFDKDPNVPIAGPFNLGPGESKVIRHTNVKTADDVARGFIDNIATAAATVVYPGSPNGKAINATSNTARGHNPTPTPTGTPPNPPIKKVPRLANLWLCTIQGAPGCSLKASASGGSVEEVNFNVELNAAVSGLDPKCLATPTPPPPLTPVPCPAQTIGSFQFEVRYDAKLVSLVVEAGALFRRSDGTVRSDVQCATISGQGFIQFRCNFKGKPSDAPRGPGTLAVVRVRATADVYSILIPSQDNGIVTQLINQDCQLSDLQGHFIKPALCDNAAVTIRYLEGDVHADCAVDVQDQQQIAFRWGSRLGSLLYNRWFDLEPSSPKLGDSDIDAKDLQVIYGRHGSTCESPHPKQNPVDPKAKIGTPTPTFTPTPTPTFTPTPT